ncbi:MAG: hypothetical protein ACTS5I_11165, partial [Rhodanobacter sp.]
FDARLNDAWTYGAKATYRKLPTAIDDVGDSFAIDRKMKASGIDPASYNFDDIQGSYGAEAVGAAGTALALDPDRFKEDRIALAFYDQR